MKHAERAIAKLLSAAAKASAGLSSCHSQADYLPLDIAKQLTVAAEETDYLRFLLHEAVLRAAIHGPNVLTRNDDGDAVDEYGEQRRLAE